MTIESVIYESLAFLEMLHENMSILVVYSVVGMLLTLVLTLPSVFSASRVLPSQAITSYQGLSPISGEPTFRFRRGPLFFKYALRSLARRKSREVVVVLVIVISVLINSTLIAASDSQLSILTEATDAFNFDFYITLNKGFNSSILEDRLEPYSDSVIFSELSYYTQGKVNGFTVFLIGAPINASYFRYGLVQGRWFKGDEDGVVLTENLAVTLNAQVDDVLTLSNELMSVNATVVGIRRDLAFNVLIISLSTVQALDDSEVKVNAVVVKAKEDVNVDHLIRDMRRTMPGYLWHIKKSGIIELASTVLTKAFQSTAAVMIVFTWMTSFFLIFSIIGQDVNEERKVVAILRALGISRSRCLMTIAFKIFVLGLLAALLCAIFTPAVLGFFSEVLSQTMVFSAYLHPSTSVLLSSVIFILGTTLSSGLALGIYVTNVKIVEAIRHE
jgi:ABC-type antimicrobial peptide transport system permease subunit